MATSDFSLHSIRTVDQVMARTPQGLELVELLRSLGFWVGGDNPLNADTRRPFPVQVSRLTSNQLGDENAYWQSELSRVTTIIGTLAAQRLELNARLARARANSAARTLDAVPEGEKPPPAATIEARVADDNVVVEAQDRVLLVDMLLVALKAVREAYDGYCRVLSREITRVGDQLKYRV